MKWEIIVLLSLGLIFIVVIICLSCSKTSKPKKRVMEVTRRSGFTEYRCEQQKKDGTWQTIQYYRPGEFYSKDAIFSSREKALNFIGEDLDPIVNEKEIKP